MVLTLSLTLLVLLLLVGWISQESEVLHELLNYQSELRNYHKKCFEIESREKIEHRLCPLGFVSLQGKCSQCSEGTLSLPHWSSCAKFLTCEDLTADIRPTSLLWQTDRWKYFSADWNSFQVVYTQINENFAENSNTELVWRTATELAPHPNTLYPIGSCAATNTIVYGIAEPIFPLTQLDSVLHENGCNNWMVRFKLAIDYVRVLDYLHLHPSGPYVLCNSHSLELLLSQFAVSRHLELLLANFDNLPSGHRPVVCSREQLHGTFIAPEQSWPYSHFKMFNADEQPGYFQTSDIWKIPDITKAILGRSPESQNIMDYLVVLHQRCKSFDYLWRPSAREVLTEYENVWNSVVGDDIPLQYTSTSVMLSHGRYSADGSV